MGVVTFTVMITLLVASASLALAVPFAIPAVWLLFTSAPGLGKLERTRVAALLGVEIESPHAELGGTTWWERWKERVMSASRWREIAYLLARLPLGALTTVLVLTAWSASAAFATLPLYVRALPGGSAELGLGDLTSGPGTAIASVFGIIGIVFIAPWLTTVMALLDRSVAVSLLGPADDRAMELEEEVLRVEARRVAAVDSAEDERRRIERDLHDGAQQRLVAVAIDLGMARERFDVDPEGARALIEEAHEEAKAAIVELRHLVQGFRPAILEDRGLDAALSSLVARVPIAVDLRVDVPTRPIAAVESAAYFVVAEALTNVVKHAGATKARVSITRAGDKLAIDVTDDGVGGADSSRGSGLFGLIERARSLGGWLTVLSPVGGPTTVIAELPCGS